MKHEARSFPPISTLKSRVLILGSVPGIKSLEAQQYYAHPHNQFWKILSAMFDAPVETYAQRVALIKNNGIALWDVLEYCVRVGSLDTRIDNKSIKVNDFAAFLKKHKQVTHVFFNGAKSEVEFRKRVWSSLPPEISGRLVLKRLPSTSPAHAGMAMTAKVKAWKDILKAF